MAKTIAGIIPIVAAPFSADGALDEGSFQSLVRHLIGTGVSALTLFGLATEFYKLADAERARMQTLMLAETTRSTSVAGIISITDHSWEVAVGRARAAEAEGADGLMLLPPFFLGPGEDAILEHLRRVIGSVRIPVIVQYAPAQTGVRISPEIFLRLRDALPNADFVKVETSPPGPYVSRLIGAAPPLASFAEHPPATPLVTPRMPFAAPVETSPWTPLAEPVSAVPQGPWAEPVAATPRRLQALVGYAGVQMPDVLARGAAGIQPGCSFAEVYVDLWRRWQAERPGFHSLHAQLLPYLSYWMQSVELIVKAEKVILQRRGLIASDYCRSPSYALDARETQQIDQFISTFEHLWKGKPA